MSRCFTTSAKTSTTSTTLAAPDHAGGHILAEPVTGEEIATVARIVRQAYVFSLHARQGRWLRYAPHPRKNWVWTKAAKLCLQHELDPAAHVRSLTETVRDPYPEMLLGEKAVERTTKFIAKPPEHRDERVYLQSQLVHLENCLHTGKDLAHVLMSETADLTSAFRYYMAVRTGLHTVATKYRYEARLELLLKPELRKLLIPLLSGAHADIAQSSQAD